MSDIDRVIACLKELKLRDLDIEYFQNRIIIQKIIFLLKIRKVSFDSYDFPLYIRGPYSTKLTDEIYKKQNDIKNLKTNHKLSDFEEKIVIQLLDYLPLKPSNLEIAATYVHFIKNEKLSHNEAIKQVKESKGFYSYNQIINAIHQANKFLNC